MDINLNVFFEQIISGDGAEIHYEVLNIETSGELDRNRLNLALNLASLIRSPSLTSIDTLTPKEEMDSGKNIIFWKFNCLQYFINRTSRQLKLFIIVRFPIK